MYKVASIGPHGRQTLSLFLFVFLPPVLLGSDWHNTIKLGEVFKIAVAITDIQVDAYYFESCLFTTKVLKKLKSERSNQDIQPWIPENLDPVVQHYLQRRGFTTTEELKQLQRTN